MLLFLLRIMADITEEIGGIHFPFPFTPYSIQKDFVAELYQVLEAGKIGMFESPTGTVSMNSGAQEGSWETSITSSQRLIYPSRDFQGLKLSKVVLSVYFSEECSLPSIELSNTPQCPRKLDRRQMRIEWPWKHGTEPFQISLGTQLL